MNRWENETNRPTSKITNTINSFSTNVPLLYPLKKSENLRFYILRGVYSEKLVENGLIHQNCPVFEKSGS